MATKTKKKTAKKKTAKKQDRPLSTAQRNRLDDQDFAFTKKRKEPIVDARHVRNAISRFDQVKDVTNAERDRMEAHREGGQEVRSRGVRTRLA